MRFKPVPAPPATVEGVETARRAVPLVPDDEGSCCERLSSRLDCSPDEARRWLTFLRALGLVTEGSSGYVRTDRDASRDALADAFRDRVYGAREVLDALGDDPRSADAVFERFRDRVTAWERGKATDWEGEWRRRVERLLEWAVLLDLADRTDGGYRRVV